MAERIGGAYAAIGTPATLTIAGVPIATFVIKKDSYEIVELAEYVVYSVLTSEAQNVQPGDTIEISGEVREIKSVKPSVDGLEIYIGVR